MAGIDLPGLEEGFFGGVEGRSYLNITNTLKVPGGMFFVKKLSRQDPIVLSILNNLSTRAYRTPGKPKELRFFIFKVIKATSRYTRLKYEPYKNPEEYKRRFHAECRRRVLELDTLERKSEGLRDLASDLVEWFGSFLVSLSLVMTTASHSIALESIKRTFEHRGTKFREAVSRLERGLHENNTVAMGLDLEELVFHESIQRYSDYDAWIAAGDAASAECRADFEMYLEKYGFRCPMEIDAATPRPVEDQRAFFQGIHERAVREQRRTYGKAQFEKARKERKEAYEFLRDTLPEGAKKRKFEKDYAVWTSLGGYREIHKHYMVLAVFRLRLRALELGRRFVAEGRLDRIEDIFKLGFDQIETALADPCTDLRTMADANVAWRRHWEAILEIGGPTQHGAVVAREYGKPCVAGIEEATEIFRDGDLVVVDGADGSVRILERA